MVLRKIKAALINLYDRLTAKKATVSIGDIVNQRSDEKLAQDIFFLARETRIDGYSNLPASCTLEGGQPTCPRRANSFYAV